MLHVNIIMIFIIHKILVLLKITIFLKHFLRSIIDFYFFKKNDFFSQHIMMKSSGLEEYKNIEENIIKDVRNVFSLKKLKKEANDVAIKGRYKKSF